MKPTIEDLQDSFKIGYEAFEASREEAREVDDLYHNRQFTMEQLSKLKERGQPAETFNIVKKYSRMLLGYYSTVVNTAVALPNNPRDTTNASVITDIITHTFERNRMDTLGDKLKLSGLLTGLMSTFTNVFDTGRKDEFGRPINGIDISYVPPSQLVLDPASVEDDYSDARFLHRFKWMTEETIIKLFGKDTVGKLTKYYNFTDSADADFEMTNWDRYTGKHKQHNCYLVVHSVIEDDEGDRWSVYWHDSLILRKDKITYRKARWPYRVQKIHTSEQPEYYGIFREVIEAQRAINLAVITIGLMASSEKVLVEEGSVENIDEFTAVYNRVNSVIPVLNLNGIRIEKFSREIQDQYIIIDKAIDRVQQVLGINDSFMGMAYASDSGRKVKLQQNAAIMSLHYVSNRIKNFYAMLGEDIASLAQQYYTAYHVMRIADELVGSRWTAVNQPMMEQVGVDAMGQPIQRPVIAMEFNPDDGEPLIDESGNYVFAPVPTGETEIAYTEFEISVEAAPYNDEDEKAQLMLETMMSGQIGVMMSQVNPAGFFKMAALTLKSMKTKYTPDIVEVLDQTAQMLGGNPEMQQQASMMAQSRGAVSQPMSRSAKLPQNTNEGV